MPGVQGIMAMLHQACASHILMAVYGIPRQMDLKRWWNLIAAAGALLAVASVAVQFVPGVWMGLGLLFFGAGEWGNHAIHVKRSSDIIIESYPWYPYPFALLLDAIGIGLFGFGLYRLVAFGP